MLSDRQRYGLLCDWTEKKDENNVNESEISKQPVRNEKVQLGELAMPPTW